MSLLRAITLPPYGGTTVWANTAEAYRRLHPALKALADEGTVPAAKVAEAIKKYGINVDKINPLYA